MARSWRERGVALQEIFSWRIVSFFQHSLSSFSRAERPCWALNNCGTLCRCNRYWIVSFFLPPSSCTQKLFPPGQAPTAAAVKWRVTTRTGVTAHRSTAAALEFSSSESTVITSAAPLLIPEEKDTGLPVITWTAASSHYNNELSLAAGLSRKTHFSVFYGHAQQPGWWAGNRLDSTFQFCCIVIDEAASKVKRLRDLLHYITFRRLHTIFF